MTEVFGCFSYPLLANARVRSSQEGGKHETSYSRGGVKKMLECEVPYIHIVMQLRALQGMKHEELNNYPLLGRDHAAYG
jgi:hypothetical protein